MRISKILYLLFLSLCCSITFAEERLYKIELIIFSQNTPDTEVFDQTESKIAWPRYLADRSSYREISSEKRVLNGSYRQLSRNTNYKPLMHVAWTQSVRANSYSKAVRISTSDGSISGFFRLQRGNLVHMIADIEYAPFNASPVIYRINEKRRFKLKETHYLDHPKFGILARVSPIK